ncbi:MAG: trigger factor [Thermodesulfobacteriota bacterium]
MQVRVENQTSVKKNLHIEIPAQRVSEEIDAAYKQLQKTAKIKGFRPGKTPRSVLERMFKKDVHSDVTSKLIQESFFTAIKENSLALVGEPKIDPTILTAGEPYRYQAAIEIRPEISAIDFKGLTLKKSRYQVSDQEVDAQIEMLRKNMAKLKPIEETRAVRDGDYIIIDYEGFHEGNPYQETQKTENFNLKVGRGAIAADFDRQLIGMHPLEEKRFDIHFPEDHQNKQLAGRTIQFQVTLKEVREEVLPNIDDDFAKKMGNFESLVALRDKITDNLRQGYEKRVEQELNEQIFEALIAKTDFEVPDSLIQYELDGILEETERALAASNVTLEQIGQDRAKLSERYRGTAEKQVRRHLILGAIVEQEKMVLSDEEKEAGFQEMAETFRQPLETIRQYYQEHQDRLELFTHTLLEKKAIRLIIENSTVEEIEPEKSDAATSEQ